MKTNNGMSKLYTGCVVLLPLFSVYASGIPGFTLGDILLFFFFALWVIAVVQDNGRVLIDKRVTVLVPLVLTIPIASVISISLQDQVAWGDIIVRIVRRVFYYACVILLTSKWFDYSRAEKLIVGVGKAGTVYLALQYVTYYVFGKVLVGYIPFLPVYHENYASLDYGTLYSNMFRPTSILLEPAHFSRYMLIPLCIVLFLDKRTTKNNIKWAVLFTIAIIATTSGIGIISVAVVWGCWLVKPIIRLLRSGKLNTLQGACIVALPIAIALLVNNSVFQSAFERILGSDLANVNTAGGARFRGFIQYFELPALFKVIGMGYGSTPNTELVTWFSGASYVLYGTGAIGFSACVYLFWKLFWGNRSSLKKALTISLILLFFMDDSFMSHVAVVYLSFTCFAEDGECPLKLKGKSNAQ